jgi:DNA-binding response OmpR family regulator
MKVNDPTLLASKTILLVEDDIALAKELIKYFAQYKASIVTATNCYQAFKLLAVTEIHLIILDRCLSDDIDGINILEHIRYNARLEMLPVIILTAKKTESDKQYAHKFHPDAYITKPFNLSDFIRQVEVILHRSGIIVNDLITIDEGIQFNRSNRKIMLDNIEHPLSKLEYLLLNALVMKNGHLATREYLINYLWDTDDDRNKHKLDVLVSRLRVTLGKYSYLIQTLPHIGYQIIKQSSTPPANTIKAPTLIDTR